MGNLAWRVEEALMMQTESIYFMKQKVNISTSVAD